MYHMKQSEYTVGVIGLGYVGLPLAVAFADKFETIGYDINKVRVNELNEGYDQTGEVTEEDLNRALRMNKSLRLTDNPEYLQNCNVIIVTVPTPVDKFKNPDLTPLKKASELVSKYLRKNDIVIYESTVYPGATEEVCIPILEKGSSLEFNKDFFVGYSPERINPGDKEHTVKKIKKVVSGSNPDIALEIDFIYKSIIEAGTYIAPSIKVAEAAKVIENSQRDINIAFVNELSKIFNLLGIDTAEVLKAASTKWNFLNFSPGLVGGHCIGVDPYYLANKALEVGYNPEIILAGRRLNDSMGKYVVDETIRLMIQKNILIKSSEILILGFTFKENCPDFRNTQVIEIYNELKKYNTKIDIYDPWIDESDLLKEYDIKTLSSLPNKKFDAIIIAVAHDKFQEIDIDSLSKNDCVIYDVKRILTSTSIDGSL